MYFAGRKIRADGTRFLCIAATTEDGHSADDLFAQINKIYTVTWRGQVTACVFHDNWRLEPEPYCNRGLPRLVRDLGGACVGSGCLPIRFLPELVLLSPLRTSHPSP